LDGLRGIAILAVLFHHNFDYLHLPKFGWAGVDLFFVLSGFLITDILLKTKDKKNFISSFFIRRVLRIFPLYYGAIILFFVLAASAEQLRDQYAFYFSNQGMLWMHMQNWMYITKSEPTPFGMFIHFWSLSVEEQFYLVWPFIILVCRRIKPFIIITAAILFLCIVFRFVNWMNYGNGNLNYHLHYMTRIDGLCVGSLVAAWRNLSTETARKKILRFSLIVFGIHVIVFSLSKTIFTSFPHFTVFGYSSIAVAFGSVLIFVVEKRNKFTRFVFENKPLMGLGKISYGLYVYHWPVLVLFKLYFVSYLMSTGISLNNSYIIACLCATVTAIMVSIASYNLFEKKILALKDAFTSDRFIKKSVVGYRSALVR
jgi:peptidoglycan/LPS O-acetylase OafA/YrhL